MRNHGLISVITHPDYLTGEPQQEVYKELLEHLAALRDRQGVWSALPGQINEWWRNRHQMTLVPDGDGFRIEGPGSERARVAYASLENGRVSTRFMMSDGLGIAVGVNRISLEQHLTLLRK